MHLFHVVDINDVSEKQGQDELLCANTRPLSPLRPDPTGGDWSTGREDVPTHAFVEKYSALMSSLAIVAVVKTRKHTAMNSIRAHDLNLLIMLNLVAPATHDRKKRATISASNSDLIFCA